MPEDKANASAGATGGKSGGDLGKALKDERDRRRSVEQERDTALEELNKMKAKLAERSQGEEAKPEPRKQGGQSFDAATTLRELLQKLVPTAGEDEFGEPTGPDPERQQVIDQLADVLASIGESAQRANMTVQEQRIQAIKARYAVFVDGTDAERRIAEALFRDAMAEDSSDPAAAAAFAAQEVAKFKADGGHAAAAGEGTAPPNPPNAGGAAFIADSGEAIAPEAKSLGDVSTWIRQHVKRAVGGGGQ